MSKAVETATQQNLQNAGTAYFTPGIQNYAGPITSLLAYKPAVFYVVCDSQEKSGIEAEIRKQGYAGEIRYWEGQYKNFTITEIQTDRPSPYLKESSVRFWVTVQNSGWASLDSVSVNYMLTRPDGTVIFTETKQVSNILPGKGNDIGINWTIPKDSKEGLCSVRADITVQGKGAGDFREQSQKKLEFTVGSGGPPPIELGRFVPLMAVIGAVILLMMVMLMRKRTALKSATRLPE